MIARWSWGLLRDTSRVLLDAEVSDRRSSEIQRAIEADADNRIADVHLCDPAHYKRLLAGERDLVHVTVEVQACRGDGCLAA